MNRYARYMMILATLFVCLTGISRMVQAAEPTSDAVRTALRRPGFPWYDAAKDQFRPVAPIKQVEPEPEKPPQKQEPLKGSRTDFSTLQTILMWVLLIAVLTVVAVIAFRTMQEALQETSASPASATVALETLEALPEPARKVHDLLGEATRQASLSAFDSAIMFYYSWQLLQLDRHQHIELQKGKTNRQYRREVAGSVPEVLDLFSPSMRLFEDAFFGRLPISRDEFMPVWEQRHRFEFTPRSRR